MLNRTAKARQIPSNDMIGWEERAVWLGLSQCRIFDVWAAIGAEDHIPRKILIIDDLGYLSVPLTINEEGYFDMIASYKSFLTRDANYAVIAGLDLLNNGQLFDDEYDGDALARLGQEEA